MESIGSMKLSIRFYVDLYSMVPNRNFTLGRIIGTIGIQGPDSPLVSPWARIMGPMVSAENKYHDAIFVVERARRRILIELGNSLPLDKIGFPFNLKNVSSLFVAFAKNKLHHFNCSDNFIWIGKIPIKDHAWFEDYAGLIWFNLDEGQAIQLQSTPLMLVEVSCPLFSHDVQLTELLFHSPSSCEFLIKFVLLKQGWHDSLKEFFRITQLYG